jgi:hypothetical protein
MFLRWKVRRLEYDALLSAVVVRSVRTAAGPRQRHVCFLGSVRRSGDYSHPHRFWAEAMAKLDAAGIRDGDRERIEADLERVVPRPAEPDERSPPSPEEQRAARERIDCLRRRAESRRR